MLRTARSMPSLRNLQSTIQNEIKQQSKQFSAASSKYNLIQQNINNNPLVLKRSVHQTAKNPQSPLLSQKRSEFNLMSLNTLKSECRKRGLKVSGRKAELISRINSHEASFSTSKSHSMSTKSSATVASLNKPSATKPVSSKSTSKKYFSNSSEVKAKGDDSHIDYIKPIDVEPPKLVKDDYITQIPSISTKASQTPVTEFEKKLSANDSNKNILSGETSNPNDSIVSKAPLSDTKIYEQSSIEGIEDQNTNASNVSAEAHEEHYEYEYGNIDSKDKTKWGVLAGIVGVWWWFKPKTEVKH